MLARAPGTCQRAFFRKGIHQVTNCGNPLTEVVKPDNRHPGFSQSGQFYLSINQYDKSFLKPFSQTSFAGTDSAFNWLQDPSKPRSTRNRTTARRARKMSPSTLKLTRFEVERMASISARNRAVPYLVNTFHGKALGSMGYIAESAMPASNDARRTVRYSARVAGHFSGGFGLKQLLTMPVW